MYYCCEIKLACRNRFSFIPRPGKHNIIINCCYVNNSIFRKWRLGVNTYFISHLFGMNRPTSNMDRWMAVPWIRFGRRSEKGTEIFSFNSIVGKAMLRSSQFWQFRYVSKAFFCDNRGSCPIQQNFSKKIKKFLSWV